MYLTNQILPADPPLYSPLFPSAWNIRLNVFLISVWTLQYPSPFTRIPLHPFPPPCNRQQSRASERSTSSCRVMTSQEKMARLTHAAPSASHSIYTAARGEQ
ncbi:hypothetical protein RRG08_063932 [Elysia crispata]|uniref:Uncharacterized protein n=1 Tax=Elysia crispata TaxID=231223 RepID=A0AAE1CXG4_9GAST|nr:hypothetical protein RRG08_063932 [Elysia crispata]